MIISEDLSKGLEIHPIKVINDIDNEKPKRFTYIVEPFVTQLYEHPEPEGCNCIGRCLNTRPCVCITNNKGKKTPYTKDGSIRRTSGEGIIYECGKNCRCNSSCHNRVSQKGLEIQLELFKTATKGWGVRSPQIIPRRSFICEYFGEMVDDFEADKRLNDTYLFDIADADDDDDSGDGFTIDGAMYGNVARFINHSHSPNIFSQKVLYDHMNEKSAHIMFFAGDDDIPPLTELTYDYGYKIGSFVGADGKILKKDCHCGSDQCTGRLY